MSGPNRAERRAAASARQTAPKPIEGQFPSGAVVKLRSGGIPMTVDGTEGAVTVCVWQDADGRPCGGKFHGTSLVLANE